MKRRWNNDLEKPEAACNGTHPTEKNAKISFTCRFHKQATHNFFVSGLLFCICQGACGNALTALPTGTE